MTTTFNPMEFKASTNQWQDACIWGGGHTLETLPTNKGWRARPLAKKRPDVLMIGQRGIECCATVVRTKLYDDECNERPGLDVAIYLESPEEVLQLAKAEKWEELSPRFVQIDEIPGFGLRVINMIERERDL
jgi:hypothetical protein